MTKTREFTFKVNGQVFTVTANSAKDAMVRANREFMDRLFPNFGMFCWVDSLGNPGTFVASQGNYLD